MVREFTCSDLASLAEREQTRMNQMFKGDLKAAKEFKGYGSTFAEYIESLKAKGLEGGPCEIDYSVDAPPVCEQLWPRVQKIIAQAERIMTPLLKLIGVKREEMSPFCRCFQSTKDLLQAYVSYCPKTFSYDGQKGEEEEGSDAGATVEPDEVGDQGEGVNQAMVAKIRQFAEDILLTRASDSNEESSNADVSASATDDGEVVVIEGDGDEDEGDKNKRAKKKKADPGALLLAVECLVNIDSVDDLLDKALEASAALELSDAGKGESGSASRDRKTKSLLGRLYGKYNPAKAGADGEIAADGTIFVERNTVVSCMVKVGSGRGAQKVDKPYRVIGLYDKSYNKWYMTGEKKKWALAMKEVDKKRYKLAIRMLKDGVLQDYDDVALTDGLYKRKDICKIIVGTEIVAVKGKLMPSVV